MPEGHFCLFFDYYFHSYKLTISLEHVISENFKRIFLGVKTNKTAKQLYAK